MHCPQCGNIFTDNSLQCFNCGFAFSAPTASPIEPEVSQQPVYMPQLESNPTVSTEPVADTIVQPVIGPDASIQQTQQFAQELYVQPVQLQASQPQVGQSMQPVQQPYAQPYNQPQQGRPMQQPYVAAPYGYAQDQSGQPIPMQLGQLGQPFSAQLQRKSFDKKILFIVLGVLALFAALFAAYNIVGSRVGANPESTIRDYVNAIAEGKFDKATSMTKDGAIKSQKHALLTNISSDVPSNKIGDITVRMVEANTARVAFTLSEKKQEIEISVEKSGKVFGLFDQYKIATPFIEQISMALPADAKELLINGKAYQISQLGEAVSEGQTIHAKNGRYSFKGTLYQFDVYPGAYTFELPKGGIIEASKYERKFYDRTLDVALDFTVNDEFENAFATALRDYVTKCLASTAPFEKGCDFANATQASLDKNPETVQRKLGVELSDVLPGSVDLVDMTFESQEINTEISYEYAVDEQHYVRKITRYDAISGKFSFDGTKVTLNDVSSVDSAYKDGADGTDSGDGNNSDSSGSSNSTGNTNTGNKA